MAYELLWHITHEAHQVLFADLGIETSPHLARVLFVGNTKVGADLCFDIAVGRPQYEVGHVDVCKGRIKSDATSQFSNLQSRLLLECSLAYI